MDHCNQYTHSTSNHRPSVSGLKRFRSCHHFNEIFYFNLPNRRQSNVTRRKTVILFRINNKTDTRCTTVYFIATYVSYANIFTLEGKRNIVVVCEGVNLYWCSHLVQIFSIRERENFKKIFYNRLHKGWPRSPVRIWIVIFSSIKHITENLSFWRKDAVKHTLQNDLWLICPKSYSKKVTSLEVCSRKTKN